MRAAHEVERNRSRASARTSSRSASSLVLSGRLEAISLADALQVIAASGQDGVLIVEREMPPERGELELRGGRVARARVTPSSETLGAILLRRYAVEAEELHEGLRRQAAAAAWRPLGEVLVEMQALAPVLLAEALSEQMKAHTTRMLGWGRGIFRFRTVSSRLPHADAQIAIDPQLLLLEAARRADEEDPGDV
ncbi:MAG: DUF4388 domain-containing protein [Acidobacteriota bacterium]|nr:MAG: DUF4388 domain-containing protein [Acidobacteriota bacterium]